MRVYLSFFIAKSKNEARKILEYIEESEKANIEFVSRYGNHQDTKNLLRRIINE